MSAVRFEPSGPLRGSLRVPGDKSISHRAALLAAMGEGITVINGYLNAADTRSTLDATRVLGAEVHGVSGGGLAEEIRIEGVGLRGATDAEIDVGNAGTLLRLLPGWLAGQDRGRWTLDGDESIRRRPVDRIAEPLLRMGAYLEAVDDRLPPLVVEGGPLNGIEYELPVASAQVKSCVLLAGLLAEGATTVIETVPTRDHTERMLSAAGAEIQTIERNGRRHVEVHPAKRVEPGRIDVPGDFSSAAFWICAAVLVPGSRVRLPGVGTNPGRTGLVEVLGRMGAQLQADPGSGAGGEEVADLTVSHHALRGTVVEADEVPSLIDELPLVALLGCFAEGRTTVRGAAELRHKESDRLETVAGALRALGGEIEVAGDGWEIDGGGRLRGGTVDSAGDHRVAMLGAVAGLASEEGVEVEGFDAAAVSYPGFTAGLEGLTAG